MKWLILATCILAASLAEGADVAAKIDLTALPPEEQPVAQGIKITSVEGAPVDTRHNTFIKGVVKLRSTGPNHVVAGKMEVEIRLLFKNRDKKWSVITSRSDMNLNQKGSQTVNLSFAAQNNQIEALTGDRNAKPEDQYAIVRYLGLIIYEEPAKQPPRVPKEWWKGLPAS